MTLKHNTTIKNKNVLGCFVGNLLFVSIADAEAYCEEMELDPNVIVYNPERAKEYAITVLPLLRELMRQAQKQHTILYQKAKQIGKTIEELDQSKEFTLKNQIDRELENENLLRTWGAMNGNSYCSSKLLDRIHDYDRIARNQVPPQKMHVAPNKDIGG